MAASQASNVQNDYTAQSEFESITYKWTIRNFAKNVRNEFRYFLKSPTFSYKAKTDDEIKWFLQIYPNGEKKEYQNHVSLFLCPERSWKCEIEVAYQFSMLNNKCEQLFEKEIEYKFITPCGGYGWLNYIATPVLLDRATGLLPNDSLTIFCKINHIGSTSEKTAIKTVPKCCLGDNLIDLFKKELFTDVSLMAQGEEFKVHKSILAARSTVFAAMFLNDMREKTQNVIEIADINKEVLRHLINFIYSGEAPVNKSVKLLRDLLAAADMYDLERLKVLCEKDLCLKVTIDTATDLLILADLHNAPELKSDAMDFVNSKITAVMKTEMWMSLVRNHPFLLNEILKYHLECDAESEKNNDK